MPANRAGTATAARFHPANVGGIVVTLANSAKMHYGFTVKDFGARAIVHLPLPVVFNFTFQHIFTSRHIKHAT